MAEYVNLLDVLTEGRELPEEVTPATTAPQSYWTLAYEEGLRIYHGIAGARRWIDRCGSESAEETLNENGWGRISPWRRDSDESVWSCFVRRIEDSEE